jgi:hypothetical protein
MTDLATERVTAPAYARGALYGLAAVGIWAGNIVVGGLGLRSSLTPWDIAAIRFAVAGSLLLPYLLRQGLAFECLGPIGLVALVLGALPRFCSPMPACCSRRPHMRARCTPARCRCWSPSSRR